MSDQRNPWAVLEAKCARLKNHELFTSLVTIGRLPSNDVQVADPQVSSLHCIISRERDCNSHGRDQMATFIEDKSSNGTFLNGKLMPKGSKQLLTSGTQVCLVYPKRGALLARVRMHARSADGWRVRR